jgi:hypothetical protein
MKNKQSDARAREPSAVGAAGAINWRTFHRHTLPDLKSVLIAPHHQIAARAELQMMERQFFHLTLNGLHHNAAFGTLLQRGIKQYNLGIAIAGRHGTNPLLANLSG